MSEYTTPMTTLDGALSSQLGADISKEILALLNTKQSGQSADTTANVITDYSGGGVPAGTDIVYVSPLHAAQIGDEMADVTAIILPSEGSATVILNGGVDRVITLGGGGDTVRISGNTSDTITNVGSGSVIDTGGGFDKVVVAGNLSDYETKVTDTGITLVNQHGSTIDIQHAEFVQFSDGSVIINAHNVDDATIAQLYNIVLDRAPDATGTNYWWGPTDGGSPATIADAFLHSQEFTAAHGSVDGLTSSEFVDIMYQNTFGREADTLGKAYWQSLLDQGTATKTDLALYFAHAKEEADASAAKINIMHDILP